MPVELFIRPEALLIEPDKGIADLNRFEVQVRAILFDGANSRLLARPANADNELLIALPQNRQYDHIRVDDRIEVGWAPTSGICFAAS
ncbi:MAG: TOBE domain-containing protein [Desulfobacterales bacterium]|nr:TOBE domain-containing protein [Desulfobacterales bacterium]